MSSSISSGSSGGRSGRRPRRHECCATAVAVRRSRADRPWSRPRSAGCDRLGQQLELTPAIPHLDAARVFGRADVVDDQGARCLEGSSSILSSAAWASSTRASKRCWRSDFCGAGCFSSYFSSKNQKFAQWSKMRNSVLCGRGRTGLRQPRAASDHLPELDVGLHRLGEDEVHDLGHVDAGVEHVHRDGDGQLVGPGS